MAKKSILISTYHHKELKGLSEAYNLNYYRLVEEMIVYFKKTGINPSDPKNENPSKGLKELDKRLVSFLKVQERDILKPLRQEVYKYSQEQNLELDKVYKKIIDAFNKLNELENERSNKILLEATKQRQGIIAIAKLIDAKNKSGILTKINKIFE